MYLFTRRGRVDGGDTVGAMTWATEVTAKASQISGLDIGLWTQVFSPQIGTLVWTVFLPDLATLETAGDKLAADAAYVTLQDSGSTHISSGLDDGLYQILHGEADPNGTPPEYVSVVQAVCATGNIANGMALGVEIAQKVESITGITTSFATHMTGSYGAVAWMTGYDNIGALESANEKLNSDPSFLSLVDSKAAGAYVEDPSITTQLLYRRLV